MISFDPRQLRGEPADLFVEFGDLLFLSGLFRRLCAFTFLENARHGGQHGGLPLAELVRMNAVFSGDVS